LSRRGRVYSLTLLASVFLAAETALAMQTDQFTTPAAPLSDIGPLLSRKIADILESTPADRDPELVLHGMHGAGTGARRVLEGSCLVRGRRLSGLADLRL
jgi:hypothetical protein